MATMFIVGFRGRHTSSVVAWLASGIRQGPRSHRDQIQITRKRENARQFAKFTAEELAKTLSGRGWGYFPIVEAVEASKPKEEKI